MEPLSRSAALAMTCTGCHVPSGEAIPSLEGWSEEVLQARLFLYKSETDGTSVMHRLMRGYEDNDIAAISAYLTEAVEEVP